VCPTASCAHFRCHASAADVRPSLLCIGGQTLADDEIVIRSVLSLTVTIHATEQFLGSATLARRQSS
jgi:hypothetical protein